MITAKHLKNIHTKVLLRALRQTRARNSSEIRLLESIADARGIKFSELHSVTDEMLDDYRRIVDAYSLGANFLEPSSVTITQLKAELATREHVPNKKESVVLRKAKQKAGRNKGRRDR